MTPRIPLGRWLWGILIVAFVLRLVFVLAQNPHIEASGGDNFWYWQNANVLVSGDTTRTIDGVVYNVSGLSSPPVYFLVIGLPQLFLPSDGAVLAVRLFQVILSTLTVYCAYRLAWRISGRKAAGLLAAAVLAVSPAFILESAQITTETVFMALLAGGLTLFAEAVYIEQKGRRGLAHQTPTRDTGILITDLQPSRIYWIGAAVLLGLATLTRSVLLLFPLALAAYWLIVPRPPRDPAAPQHMRLTQQIGRVLAFGAIYLAVVLTWTGYNLIRWNRVVIGGGDITAFLYIGATGWADPHQVDQRLESQAGSSSPDVRNYSEGAAAVVSSDPLGYVQHRLSEWSGAILQPHGTVYFPGESLRDLAVNWITQDRSLSGLLDVIRGDAFGSKLLIYSFHYATLILGLIGLWRVRRVWPLVLPPLAYIAYTAAIHLVILALPRYWFPTMIFWTVFAACAFFGAARKEHAA